MKDLIKQRAYWNGKEIVAEGNKRYEIGSQTKMFTAAAIFKLIDEGKLKLDDEMSGIFNDKYINYFLVIKTSKPEILKL